MSLDITIFPRKLSGPVAAIPSKSQAHRLLLCAALADRPTEVVCPAVSRDIEATAACLEALGAGIRHWEGGYTVTPIAAPPKEAVLCCGESGSTLRFLLPVAAALGVDATFLLAGRLPERPLSPLWELMEQKGCRLSRPSPDRVRCQGQLQGGEFAIDGGVSSQFVTGLLFAAALLPEKCQVRLTGKVESRPYLAMTREALGLFGIDTAGGTVSGRFRSPGRVQVEGDWSNAAFFLGAQALGSPLTLTGLDPTSCQGDRAVSQLLPRLEEFTVISAGDIPDLVPLLAVVAGAKAGAEFREIRRLRLKESDRVASTAALLEALGGWVQAEENTLRVFPAAYRGGTVDPRGDHRIAMAAAIAATVAAGPITILDAQCVEKSYPDFWAVYRQAGGSYEQHLR